MSAIKSDGGSSSYYDIALPEETIEYINTHKHIKTEQLIMALGNDFDEGNVLKCLVRVISLRNGKGKEGNSVEYDCNKMLYSVNKIKQRGKKCS